MANSNLTPSVCLARLKVAGWTLQLDGRWDAKPEACAWSNLPSDLREFVRHRGGELLAVVVATAVTRAGRGPA